VAGCVLEEAWITGLGHVIFGLALLQVLFGPTFETSMQPTYIQYRSTYMYLGQEQYKGFIGGIVE
jgi:hypothetical protein